MRLVLPVLLRRILLASLLVPVSFSASAADFIVDAAQTSDPAHNIYTTLDDLARSGSLAAGDMVVLNNDDASLTTGLTVPVNFRSDDPDTPRTVDLSGLGNNPMYNLAEGEYTLDMDSVIWANGAGKVIQAQGGDISLELTGHVQFLNNSVLLDSANIGGGAIYMSGKHSRLTFGDHASFSGNHAHGSSYGDGYILNNGGAIHLSGSNSAIMTFGDHASFSGNYTLTNISGNIFNFYNSYGGAIYLSGINSAIMDFGDYASFSGNYVNVSNISNNDVNLYTCYGGAIFMNGSDSILAFGDYASFSGNYVSYSNVSMISSSGGAIHLSGFNSAIMAFGDHASFSGNYAYGSSNGGAIYMSGGNSTILAFGDYASFSGNYAYGDGCGGAIFMIGSSDSILTFGDDASFSGNYAHSSSDDNDRIGTGGAIYI